MFEFETVQRPLKANYEKLLRRPLGTAAIPIVRLRKGPSTAKRSRNESLPVRFIRQVYQRIYGEWPHVTRLSVYWAPLRHLLHINESAKARGAKDVLLIGNCFNIMENILNLKGLHAWVSVAGIESGNFGRAFDERPEFDLCICSLALSELDQLSKIYDFVRPFMRPAGTVVGFHFNPDGTPIAVDPGWNMPFDWQIYYAGSKRSVKALRALRSSISIDRPVGPVYFARIATMLVLSIPRAFLANRSEAATPSGHHFDPLSQYTSITVEIRVPSHTTDLQSKEQQSCEGS
jgi:hypothetical protein